MGRKVKGDWKPWRSKTSKENAALEEEERAKEVTDTHPRFLNRFKKRLFHCSPLSFIFVIFIIFFVNRLLMLGHDKVLMLIKCLFVIAFILLIIFTLKLHLALVGIVNSSCGLFMLYFYLFMIYVVLIHI